MRKRHRLRNFFIIATLAAGIVGILAWANLFYQFKVFDHIDRAASFTVRWEMAQLAWKVASDHPLGLGPRGHGYLDMDPYRDWITHQAPDLFRYAYHGSWNPEIEPLYDPHSQYTNTLLEGGWLGIVGLFWLWGAALWMAWQLLRIQDAWFQGIGGILFWMLWIYVGSGTTVMLMHQAGNIIFFGVLSAASIAAARNLLSSSESPPQEATNAKGQPHYAQQT
ncbi:MAG: O-antigen ligase domain-containing protein [Zetaproteobacteria bacterium]|nr:MAG: O-antigen ligase domain-containing protein [Zetaproteobacteria bacterium]